MQEIIDYLSDQARTLENGLALLKEHSQNNHLVKLIETRKDQKKLDAALQSIASSVIEIGEVSFKKASEFIPDPNTLHFVGSKEPAPGPDQEEIAHMAVQLKDLYNQRCELSNALADILEEEALKAHAEKVLAKREEYNALYEKYKAIANGLPYEEEHPETEAEKKFTPKDISADLAVIKAQLQPLREKASKLRAKIKDKPSDQKLAEWQTELEQTVKCIEDLESKKSLLK